VSRYASMGSIYRKDAPSQEIFELKTRSLSDFSCVIIESAAKTRTDDRERQSVQTMR
jgi:hypothetical protein